MQQLTYFETSPFIDALKKFFADLHLPLHYLADEPAHPRVILGKQFKSDNPAQKLIRDIYALGVVDDAAFGDHKSTFDDIEEVRKHQKQYDGILILGVTLSSREKGLLPARGQLAEITRALNREFVSMPVVVVFRYEHYIAFANCERDAYKHASRDGEKAGKVSLLRDINIDDVHAGHLRILDRLKVPGGISTFDALYQYWQQALNVSLLNKDFYRDLSNWFFAAKKDAKFPDTADNATERGLIRLITRLIFTWFIKERHLVPEQLFDAKYLQTLLKDSKPESDTYYRAVLQNLFFATLNSEMNERRFCSDKGGPHKQKGDYALNCFRYADEFNDQNEWLERVKDVPFLNGGLFECLDHATREGEYIDGFSRNPKQQAHLRNDLFWGEKWEADLSGVYDDKRKAKVEVTPLLNLLHSYKFTIAENTPLEEDVALDPELLGKVFENLLASYNPETRTTARKQTGSFYTPREIVNYMVEEALYAYLVGACGGTPNSGTPNSGTPNSGTPNSGTPNDDNPENGACRRTPLRMLLSDTDSHSAQELGFSTAQIEMLVNAINHCTILDPACGSGAFPMGALAKMVALLKKLDPENNLWRAAQLNAVAQRLQQESSSSEAKAQAQAETQKIFEDNAPDYARKLFLIEKCLFGSDIQPVALQITKLRFFIALIIDQNIDRAKDNWGIRALPNLETKFVAANTLISLPQRGSTLFDTKELQAHKAQLFDKRRQHIAPKNRREKKQLEEDDKKLRALIKDELLDLRFDEDGARLIAEYNPYDQNATAPFFDPEWMFGPDVKDGFDIVIGNPPYGAEVPDARELVKQAKDTKNGNSAALFIDFAKNRFVKCGGCVTFIVPKSILYSEKWLPLAQKLKASSASLVDVEKGFENVLLEQVVFVYVDQKTVKDSDFYTSQKFLDRKFIRKTNIPKSSFERFEAWVCDVSASEFVIGNKMLDSSIKLGCIADISRGLPIQSRLSATGAIPVLGGVNLFPYGVRGQKGYVSKAVLTTVLKKSFVMGEPKIMAQNIVAHIQNPHPHLQIIAALDSLGNIANLDTVTNIWLKDKTKNDKYILGLLHSTTLNWFLYRFVYCGAIRTMHFDSYYVGKLPIPTATPGEQSAIASKVEQVLSAKAHDPAAEVSTLEREIDELVAALYGLDDAEKQLVGIE